MSEQLGDTQIGTVIDDYGRGARRYELLTAEQEVELAKSIEVGLYAEKILLFKEDLSEDEASDLMTTVEQGREAKELFINSNLRLALKWAIDFARKNPKVSLEDAVQYANIGLIDAVERFDYKKGFKFSTFAPWRMHHSLQEGLYKNEDTVRIPVANHLHIEKYITTTNKLTVKLGRAPSDNEVATAMEVGLAKIQKIKKERDILRVSSTDEILLGYDDTTANDTIEDPSDPFSFIDEHDFLKRIDIVLSDSSDEEKVMLEDIIFGNTKATITTRRILIDVYSKLLHPSNNDLLNLIQNSISVEAGWMEDAACRGVGHFAFFNTGRLATKTTKNICQNCPVVDSCLSFAKTNKLNGVWGLTTKIERRKIPESIAA